MKQSFFTSLLLTISISMSEALLSQNEFKIIGHRGAMGYELENTRASFQKAIEFKVEMIELDVFRCASGEIVVFHDENLARLSTSKENIESLSLTELRTIHLTNGETIPTLEEVLELINGQVELNIELKGKHTAQGTFELISKSLLTGNWKMEDFVISSFDWDELKAMRKIHPTISIAILTEENPIHAISIANELRAIAINPWYQSISKKVVSKIHTAGFKVYTYTVNKEDAMLKMKEFNVDGIFTNFPDIALKLRNLD